MRQVPIETAHGTARARLHEVEAPRAALVLTHGAGGGIDAPDLAAVTQAVTAIRVSVALIEQPYRVAGLRAPPPIEKAAQAWATVTSRLSTSEFDGLPVFTGGRSFGARVALRTSGEASPGVLCLAFPLHPPGKPEKTRLPELEAFAGPVLIVQGDSDPFGMPPAAPGRRVVTVPGNHSLKGDLDAVARTASGWIDGRLRLREPAMTPSDAEPIFRAAIEDAEDPTWAAAVLTDLSRFDASTRWLERWCVEIATTARDPWLRGVALVCLARYVAGHWPTISRSAQRTFMELSADPEIVAANPEVKAATADFWHFTAP